MPSNKRWFHRTSRRESSLLRKRFFFDANVYRHAADGHLNVDLWRRSVRVRRCECVLTAITLLELLEWLISAPDDESFGKRQNALKLAWDLSGKHVTEFPSNFLKLKIFGIREVPPDFGQRDLQRWHRVAIKAKTKDDLFECRVPSTVSRRKTYGLSESVIRNTLKKGRALLNDQITRLIARVCPEYQSLRARGGKTLLTQDKLRALDRAVDSNEEKTAWAERIVEFAGLSKTIAVTPPVVSKVTTGLGAALTHVWFIRRQALTSPYNYERDTGLVVDSQLLFYLADPSYVLVTNDDSLRHAIAASPQSKRVLSFAAFSAQASRP